MSKKDPYSIALGIRACCETRLTCQCGRKKQVEIEEKMMSIRHKTVTRTLIHVLLETRPVAIRRNTIGGMGWREFAVSFVTENLRRQD